MAQRNVEIFIGRLITDEEFRQAFSRDSESTLAGFVESGHDLTELEIRALEASHVETWEWYAERIDPRLLKAPSGRGDRARSAIKRRT